MVLLFNKAITFFASGLISSATSIHPVAALGYLSPMFGALVMGFSDVVLAINSIRLKFKKVI